MTWTHNYGAMVTPFALRDIQRVLAGPSDHPNADELDAQVVAELRKHREDAANRTGHLRCNDYRCRTCTTARRLARGGKR